MEELNEILKKVESGLVQFFSGSNLRMTYERRGTVLVAKWGG